jgi:hypothetical protein
MIEASKLPRVIAAKAEGRKLRVRKNQSRPDSFRRKWSELDAAERDSVMQRIAIQLGFVDPE